MYHIKADKRSQTSAKLISNALYECLKKKDFFDITITDVQRTSGTGRATFYRLFDNLSDVLFYQGEQIFKHTLDEYKEHDNQTLDDFFIIFINHWMEHEKLLETIIKCNRSDILFNALYKNKEDFKFFFTELHIEESQLNYFLGFLTSVLIGILLTWIKYNRKETPDQIYNNVQNCSKLFYNMMIKNPLQ